MGRITAHIQGIGDVEGRFGHWVGIRGSGQWIEGLSVTPPLRIPREKFEYSVAFDRRWLSPWVTGESFCGSRGFSLPIFGIGVRLIGDAAAEFELTYSATFVDGTSIDSVPAGKMCLAASLAPLEAFRIVVAGEASADRYVARTIASMTTETELEDLLARPLTRAVLAPAGIMEMPARFVTNVPPRLPTWARGPDGGFARQIQYPAMWLARMDDVQYRPFAPPFFPESKELVSDFLIPWGPEAVGWFHYADGAYEFQFDPDFTETIDTAFYMGHPISGHFGHFVADCLCRMHAWRACRQLFGDVKIVLEYAKEDTTGFRRRLLMAAGANPEDIVFVSRPTHCRRLLLAIPSLSVERYASPTSARLWQQLRDAFGAASTGQPDRIYLSRSRQTARKLTNEAEVEALFRDFGFAIVHPEELSIDQQIALISNAVLIAGPGGSGMYNLAFQRRLKSVFLLISDAFMQLTEWLLLAGSTCTVCYHIGTRDMLARSSVAPGDAWRVDMATLTLDVASWLAKETASLSAPPLDTEGRSG